MARPPGRQSRPLALERLEARYLLSVIDLVSGVGGTPGSSFSESGPLLVSADGRYVAFLSMATNLVSGATDGQRHALVKDMQTGTITLLDSDPSGNQGNGGSAPSAISADGRYIAFGSDASDLVTGDTNGRTDAFVKDLQTGTTARVSTDSAGNQATSGSGPSAMSADGRYIVLGALDGNLVSGDTNGYRDVLLKDTITGRTTRISMGIGGDQPNGDSMFAAISADGRYVGFRSSASNLVSGDANGFLDVFVIDLRSGTTMRVSTDSMGNQANGDSLDWWSPPGISGGGRYVAFYTNAGNLVDGDTNGVRDVFIKDMQTGVTTRVSTDSAGNQGNGDSFEPQLSADGRYVAFTSGATNLVSGDTNGKGDVFVKDRLTGAIACVSTGASGDQSNGSSYHPAISADGRYITFTSTASNLAGGPYGDGLLQNVFRAVNPLAPADPPHVLAVTPNLTTVTDTNLGPAKFQMRIAFDKDMNLNSTPMLICTPNVADTLTQSAGWWINRRTYYAQYDVADANVNVSNISLVVWGAKDASGNAQAAYNGPAGFSIDTQSPAPASAQVTGAAPSVATITDNNTGTAAFAVRITYDQTMNTGVNPAVTFSPDVRTTLTYNRAQSWWVSNTAFVARYDVADANVAVANVGINVASVLDATGNVQTPYNGPNAFSIDTLDPAPPWRTSRAQRRTWRW